MSINNYWYEYEIDEKLININTLLLKDDYSVYLI